MSDHRTRRLEKVNEALEGRGVYTHTLHPPTNRDPGIVDWELYIDDNNMVMEFEFESEEKAREAAWLWELHERLQEAEEVERIKDPVLRSVTRRVNAFKRGERKVV